MPPLMTPSDLISGAWDNYRKNFRLYANFVIWYTLIAVIEWAVWTTATATLSDRITRDLTFAALSLPSIFAVFVLSVMMIDVTAKILQNKAVDLRVSFSNSFHKVFPFIWVIFLVTVVVVLGLILFIIPFLIFAVWYRFAQDFTAVDDVRGFAAMRASRQLVRGRWGAVALRIFVPAIFYGVAVSFIRAIVFLVVGTLSGYPGLFFGTLQDVNALSTSQGLITTVLPQIITAFAFPLFVGSDLLLWFDLKRRT